jgi:CHAT domain-containing protein/tetratricopeptide (TPR) repeat protein
VRSPDKTATAGRYLVKIDELRMATEQDRNRVAAEGAYAQAELLRGQGTAGSLKDAITKFQESLPLFRALADSVSEATTLNNMARTYSDLGDKQKALDSYASALLLFRAIGDRRSQAVMLNNIGSVYRDLGEKQRALDSYTQSLALRRAVGDRNGEATTLNNLGTAYDDLGDKRKALEFYAQAMSLFRTAGDRRSEATMLNNIGKAYDNLGETQKSLDFYAQALSLRRAVGDPRGEGATLSNIGMVYKDLGETRKALDYFTQALPLFRTAGDRGNEAVTLNNLGGIYNDLGEKQKELDYLTQALVLYRAVGGRNGEANTLNNIGMFYDDLGERRKALDSLAQALAVFRAVGDRDGEARALSNIGWVNAALGEKQQARDSYAQALPLFRAVGDRAGEGKALYRLAYLERGNGNLGESLTDVATALTIVDSLRSRIGSQELRASYFATVQDYQEFYIDLLMRLHEVKPSEGYDGRALQASEHGRARSLLETLVEAHADIRQGVDATLLAHERALQQQLNIKAQQQATLLGGTHTPEQAAALASELEGLTTDLQQAEAAIRTTSPRYAALTQPSPLNLKEVQQQLDASTVLLEYSLGTEASFLWAVTPTTVTSYELPKRAEIETAARRFNKLLNTRSRLQEQEMRETARGLSQMLLGPVTAQLGHKRLVVVADGILQYLPFAALADPASLRPNSGAIQPLIVGHEIVSLPSLSVLATSRQELRGRTPAPQTLAVLADPVFYPDDERVRHRSVPQPPDQQPASSSDISRLGETVKQSAGETGALRDGDRLTRLTGSRKEAEGILAMVSATHARRAFDFEASREFASSGELSRYRYVHFATHALLNSLHPELTAIVLSLVDANGNPQDGFLRAHEVYNLNLPAELIVLSACETGLGKEVKGEGLVGLTRGFLYAGAARVVVSLWSVDDNATASLMVDFYKGMLKSGMRPAEALRTAQITMWKTKGAWQAPYYWAAFVLQGEWR